MTKELDIIIFGATGFTGNLAIPIVAKLSKARGRQLSWGIAGRSEKKLKKVLSQHESKIGTSTENIPIVIANVEDEQSLLDMARRTRVIINCCGPYRFLGEQVVKACIQAGTHHVDMSAEPQNMEQMQLKYHKAAQEKGIYIVSACGFGSIPADLGVVYLQKKFKGTLNSVVSHLDYWFEEKTLPGSHVHYGTWASILYYVAYFYEIVKIRRELFPTPLPPLKPKIGFWKLLHKTDLVDGWNVPYPGPDYFLMTRSQRCFHERDAKRPVQIRTYFLQKSLLRIIGLIFLAAMFGILGFFRCGRYLLLKYPSFFSYGLVSRDPPPSEEKLDKSWFSFTLYGEGWKEPSSEKNGQYSKHVDSSICARVKGRNPGYLATNICLVLAAIKVITETQKLPSNGGVFPPGYAFAETSLIEELDQNGITFSVVFEKNKIK